MPFAVMVAGFVILYKSRPDLFGWNARGFHTLLIAVIITVILVIKGAADADDE
jgi:hypothetical protein